MAPITTAKVNANTTSGKREEPILTLAAGTDPGCGDCPAPCDVLLVMSHLSVTLQTALNCDGEMVLGAMASRNICRGQRMVFLGQPGIISTTGSSSVIGLTLYKI